MENLNHEGQKEIFCKVIHRKDGRIIRPKTAKFFHFWVNENSNERNKQISMFDNEDLK